MSGGHWNHEEYKIQELLERVGTDTAIRERFPSLAIELQAMGSLLTKIVRDLDYDISGDTSIKDDAAFEREALRSLGSPLKGR